MSVKILLILYCGFTVQWYYADGFFPSIKDEDCCSIATGACKEICQQVLYGPEIHVGAVRLRRECSVEMVEFWNCANQTVADATPWFGRICCNFSQSEKCEHACHNANSVHNVVHSCRKSDEPELFDCIEQQQIAEDCCSGTENTQCYYTCKKAFQLTSQPNEEIGDDVVTHCSHSDPLVLQCVQNHTRKDYAVKLNKYAHCCENSPNKMCKETCHRLLHTTSTVSHVISELQNGGCGAPSLHEKFWQCFLQRTVSKSDHDSVASVIKTVGIDSAKLHCCFTATSGMCKDLCIKTFSNDWSSSFDTFIKECLSFPSEEKLQYCLDEIEEPCELGCSGLSYCTNFNRPTELFRSCTAESDEAAREDVALWQSQGFINVFGFQLPFRNITQCNPSVWKAFACILQIKPCQTNTQAIKICREDCHELLDQCLDWNRIPPGLSTSLLCSRFDYTSSENPDTPCVSVKTFLQPAKISSYQVNNQIIIPCKDNPCDKQNVCLVDRQCYNNYQKCSFFRCVPGCRLGEISEYLVPVGTQVRLPIKTDNLKELCYKTCQCSANGVLNRCQELPCVKPDYCIIADTRIEHGSQFITNCNICSCYAGETICTGKRCPSYSGLVAYEDSVIASTLPCNCLPHFIPVCGRNGKTYHNSCLARCAALTINDFTSDECSFQSVCEHNNCKPGEVCVPDRKVCLSLLSKPCPQYRCVSFKRSCSQYVEAPVCDEDNDEHRNLCYLLKKRKRLAYDGPCLKTCNKFEIVCGTDGNTYNSECVAHGNFIQVDYKGPCVAVGLVSDYHKPCETQEVKCPPLPDPNCHRITPPEACCPVCAGAFRVLYSQKQVDRIIHQLGSAMTPVFTVKTIIKALERHIRVIDCTIRGHLTVESDLVIIITPSTLHEFQLKAEICQKEAEKVAVMIQTSSPRITSELSLSVLTTAVSLRDLHSSTRSFYSSTSNVNVAYLTMYLSFIAVGFLFRYVYMVS